MSDSQLGKSKMKDAALPMRFAAGAFALAVIGLLPGCPEQAHITVSIKPEAGAVETSSAGETAAETEAAGYGNLVGTVTYDGASGERPPLVTVGDPKVKPDDKAVCAATPIPDETLLVNSANKGLANVVIFLEKRPANIKPELAKPPSDPVLFDQKGCRFIPHVLTVQVGQPLLVVSDDAIPHNTHTNPNRNNTFNQVIKAHDRKGVACDYKKPESGPISVVCDYHSWMSAYHFPLDHPYVAVTDKDGKFKIEGLPAGKQAFNVWHERVPGTSHLLERKLQITIAADRDTTHDLSYGASKFAQAPSAVGRTIAYERLVKGGEIVVTQTEGQR